MNLSEILSIPAGEAITQYQRVKISTNGKCYVAGASDYSVGVAAYHDADPSITGRDIVAVQRHSAGISFAIANAAIAAGGFVQAAASGKVAPLTNGPAIGVALTAAAADTQVIEVIFFQSPGVTMAPAVLTAGATPSFAPGATISRYTLTPGEDETINAVTTNAIVDHVYYLEVVTSGTSSFTLTFGTNFKKTGTLATGTSNAKTFMLGFLFDGTNFVEVSRTAAE